MGGATEKCKIYDVATIGAPATESFSDFDNLLKELESDSTSSLALKEGRKWVGEKFYGQHRTLAALRLSAGLSQSDLANSCSMSQPHISRYESGKHEPGISVAKRLASAMGVTLEEFASAWQQTRKSIEPEVSK
jgi:DNA-binding XRE family transcriptional regulator